MPKFNNADVQNILTIGAGSSEGVAYRTASNHRYLRLHALDFRFFTTTGATFSMTPYSGDTGSPAIATLGGSGVDAHFLIHPNIPKAAVIDSVFIYHRAPGAETNRSSLAFRYVSTGGGVPVEYIDDVPHTADSPSFFELPVDHTDFQISTDPAGGADFRWYQLDFHVRYDLTAGGAQVKYFYGAHIKYHFPVNTPIREAT